MKHLEKNIFALYGRVLKGDKEAKKEFIKIYTDKYGANNFISDEPNKENLHIMYLHLTK